ncbi:hypothetical protein GCM10022243_28470 [Saccharothrix violaceirubra]|uniref:Peptidoglycan/LPS O-acetylase OafA/YrhL n=1 Tax=Saccharothrix violaceirubra TaxID=413306 RepID=A0A7W7WZU7_9PSEU|nr:acyltransferase [Saccharothrix violaceirubra]MBB4969228.1 peptidoglycan/LPS O-acetylase OafA/YrhL [Saccharothrix violaceirubra]
MSTAELERPRTTRARLHGVDLLRVIACGGVLLTHVLAWFTIVGRDWWLWVPVEQLGTDVLHLNSRFAFFGVITFFVVSGLVITHVTDRESPGVFLWRRISRIAPLLFVVSVIGWIMVNAGQRIAVDVERPLDLVDLLMGMTLNGHLVDPEVGLLGVTWTLRIQVIFYVLVALSIPLLRRRPWIPPLAMAALDVVLLAFYPAPWLLDVVGLLPVYLPLLCMGQLITLVHSGKVNAYAGTAIGVLHCGLFVLADRMGFQEHGDAGARTAIVIVLLTVAMVHAKDRVSRSAVVKALAQRTYAVYLVHLCVLYPLFDWLMPYLDPTLVVVLGVAAVAVVAEVLHRWVELPLVRVIRRRR